MAIAVTQDLADEEEAFKELEAAVAKRFKNARFAQGDRVRIDPTKATAAQNAIGLIGVVVYDTGREFEDFTTVEVVRSDGGTGYIQIATDALSPVKKK